MVMAGLLSKLILKGVVKSALAFEAQSIAAYRGLRSKAGQGRGGSDTLDAGLCHLLAEEELHRKILEDTATGRLSLPELETLLREHLYSGLADIRPLDPQSLALWEGELSSALEHEERTLIFYGNLRRMSRIPAVRKAFEVLGAMEKEHLEILRRLMGLAQSPAKPPFT